MISGILDRRSTTPGFDLRLKSFQESGIGSERRLLQIVKRLDAVEKALFIGEIDSTGSSALDRPEVSATEFQLIPSRLLGGSYPIE
jgi:hypothetical protein